MKTPRQRAIAACDAAFSRYIRARDRYTCYTCGSQENIQCSHLITCERMSTRWDPHNARAQCIYCNELHEDDASIYLGKWIGEHGRVAYEKLLRKSWTPMKLSVDDIRGLAKRFSDMAKRRAEI